jgi:diamine N-acetyltransferase
MSVTIRKCELSDLMDLQAISCQTYDDTFRAMNTPETMEAYLSAAFDLSKLEAELRDPRSTFFFLYDGEHLAGYLKVNEYHAQTEGSDPTALEIERIYVKKEFQGLGYGKWLIQYALEIARKRNKRSAWLGVWEKNEKAIAFYERMGFVKTGTHIFVMGKEQQTDFVMRMELQAQG